jgi:hypothetical protein
MYLTRLLLGLDARRYCLFLIPWVETFASEYTANAYPIRRFIGVSDIATVRFSLPAQLLEPQPNLGMFLQYRVNQLAVTRDDVAREDNITRI